MIRDKLRSWNECDRHMHEIILLRIILVEIQSVSKEVPALISHLMLLWPPQDLQKKHLEKSCHFNIEQYWKWHFTRHWYQILCTPYAQIICKNKEPLSMSDCEELTIHMKEIVWSYLLSQVLNIKNLRWHTRRVILHHTQQTIKVNCWPRQSWKQQY